MVLTAPAADGVSWVRLEIAIRRRPNFVISSDDTQRLVLALVKADLRAAHMSNSLIETRLAVAVSGRQKHTRELAELAVVARNQADADEFYELIETPGKYATHRRLNQLTAMVGTALAQIGGVDCDTHTVKDRCWRLLARLWILEPEVELPRDADWAALVNVLEPVAIGRSQDAATALRNRLEQLSAEFAQNAGTVDVQLLRQRLHGEIDPAPHVSSAGWNRLRELDLPIARWDPLDLGIHPAAPPPSEGPAAPPSNGLPAYVRRHHDRILADVIAAAASGSSKLAILVGGSSVGKTRACWEAIQPLSDQGWHLWHPLAPARAEAAVAALKHVRPKTVVWLDEAHQYLGMGGGNGERLAAELAELLIDANRAPILILCTLWPEYANRYSGPPRGDRVDLHAQARTLIAHRRIIVPDKFDAAAISVARSLANAGDKQLAGSLRRATDGYITQDLAGGPELVHRYRSAKPAARSILQAAMDARRLGIGTAIPLVFLENAAEGYLTETEYDALSDEWFERAIAELARPVHGDLSPLRRIRTRQPRQPPGSPVAQALPVGREGPVYRLADYLEQLGRRERVAECPPASFWHAAYDHLSDPEELSRLAKAALRRYRLQWAYYLQRASGLVNETGSGVQADVVRLLEISGDSAGADMLVRDEAAAGQVWALLRLAAQAECASNTKDAAQHLTAAAETGHLGALVRLLHLRKDSGDTHEVQRLTHLIATRTGRPPSYFPMMWLSREGRCRYIFTAPTLATQTSSDGHVEVLFKSSDATEDSAAEALLERARREREAGELEESEQLARQAADLADAQFLPTALWFLIESRLSAGDTEGAVELAQRAEDAGNTDTFTELADILVEDGDYPGAERLLWRAIGSGSNYALVELAELRRRTGDTTEAEALANRAIIDGEVSGLFWLAHLRHHEENEKGKLELVRRGVDGGGLGEYFIDGFEPWQFKDSEPWLLQSLTSWWPYGLDPDGTPTQPWPAPST
ncbi:tetratricopeptide repeat protein [Nocardia nova]|uniref:tetratricopeptide repeat protein n=1 Tax=Nocardia nova TaxID=37330 RepID=UPI0037B64BFF